MATVAVQALALGNDFPTLQGIDLLQYRLTTRLTHLLDNVFDQMFRTLFTLRDFDCHESLTQGQDRHEACNITIFAFPK